MTHQISVRIPGKVMLAGEYAVLKGGPCLAASTTAVMEMTGSFDPSKTYQIGHQIGQLKVESCLWPKPFQVDISPSFSSQSLKEHPEFFVKALGEMWSPFFQSGDLILRITKGFDTKMGMGSSSALCLGLSAIVEGLKTRTGHQQADDKCLNKVFEYAQKAWQCQQKFQGWGSGYDIATQAQGGLVRYEMPASSQSSPLEEGLKSFPKSWIQKLNKSVYVVVGGKGAPTRAIGTETIRFFDEKNLWPSFLNVSKKLVQNFQDWLGDEAPEKAFMDLLETGLRWRFLMEEAPSWPRSLLTPLRNLPGCDLNWTFKTTGAGGEDALLLLGPFEALRPALAYLDSKGWRLYGSQAFSDEGLQIINPIQVAKGL